MASKRLRQVDVRQEADVQSWLGSVREKLGPGRVGVLGGFGFRVQDLGLRVWAGLGTCGSGVQGLRICVLVGS